MQKRLYCKWSALALLYLIGGRKPYRFVLTLLLRRHMGLILLSVSMRNIDNSVNSSPSLHSPLTGSRAISSPSSNIWIHQFHAKRSRIAPNSITEYRPREANALADYFAGQASAWLLQNGSPQVPTAEPLQSRLIHPMICYCKPMRSYWARIEKGRLSLSCENNLAVVLLNLGDLPAGKRGNVLPR